jgi:protein AFG1
MKGQRKYSTDYLGQQIGSKWKLLCLDEFQVLDIADAMILRSILNGIIHTGSILMITSNRSPISIAFSLSLSLYI